VNDNPAMDDRHTETDEQLMEAFAAGSADAFSHLFQRYKSRLYAFFCRRIQDRCQAEELTQDTFVAILRAADRYQPNAQFRTYLYATALNILRAHRRKTFFRALFSGKATEQHEPQAASYLEAELALREAVATQTRRVWEVRANCGSSRPIQWREP
jgi:RNA polymerase sigma-70 factor, ECF subfamily